MGAATYNMLLTYIVFSPAIAAICRNYNADQSTLAPGPLDPELKRALLKNLLYIPNNLLATYAQGKYRLTTYID